MNYVQGGSKIKARKKALEELKKKGLNDTEAIILNAKERSKEVQQASILIKLMLVLVQLKKKLRSILTKPRKCCTLCFNNSPS